MTNYKMSVEEIKRIRGSLPSEENWTWPNETNRAIRLADTALALYEKYDQLWSEHCTAMKDQCDTILGLKAENERLRRYERAWKQLRKSSIDGITWAILNGIAFDCGIKEGK